MSFQFISVSAGAVALTCSLLMTGCTQIPELEDKVPARLEKEDYPPLVPVETLLAERAKAPESGEKPEIDPNDAQESGQALQQELEGRRDALQERAQDLIETPVVDDETKARMAAGVQQ